MSQNRPENRAKMGPKMGPKPDFRPKNGQKWPKFSKNRANFGLFSPFFGNFSVFQKPLARVSKKWAFIRLNLKVVGPEIFGPEKYRSQKFHVFGTKKMTIFWPIFDPIFDPKIGPKMDHVPGPLFGGPGRVRYKK